VGLASVAYVRVLLIANEPGARERATQLLVRALDIAHTHGMRALAQECRKLAERGSLTLPDAPRQQAASGFGVSWRR